MEEVIETEKELDIEDTKNQRSFIGTTKKPFWFIYWLASQSIREDTTAVDLVLDISFMRHNREV